jgi:hypothetical protein
MEEAGWIERRPDPSDRRARRLFLTAKARPILGRIWKVANETRDEALARLNPGEAETLIDLLHRVHDTLSARVPASEPVPVEGEAAAAPAARPTQKTAAALREPVGETATAAEVHQ